MTVAMPLTKRAVGGLIRESIRPHEARVGGVRERAVGVQNDRAVGRLTDDRRRQGRAAGAEVVAEHPGRRHVERAAGIRRHSCHSRPSALCWPGPNTLMETVVVLLMSVPLVAVCVNVSVPTKPAFGACTSPCRPR